MIPLSSWPGLDGRGDDPVHADAVAAHDERDLGPLSSRNVAPIALEYFVPSLKTWPISIPCVTHQRLAAARAGVALDGVAQVEHAVEREVAAGDDARQVDVDLVAADDDARHRGDGVVDRPAGS